MQLALVEQAAFVFHARVIEFFDALVDAEHGVTDRHEHASCRF
jgi:hypothetical protein